MASAELKSPPSRRSNLASRLYWMYAATALGLTVALVAIGGMTLGTGGPLATSMALPAIIAGAVSLVVIVSGLVSALRKRRGLAAGLLVVWTIIALGISTWLAPTLQELWIVLALTAGIFAALFLPWFTTVPATFGALGAIWLVNLTILPALDASQQTRLMILSGAITGLSVLLASAAGLIGYSQGRMAASDSAFGDAQAEKETLQTRNEELAQHWAHERDRITAILDHSTDGIVLADSEGQIIQAGRRTGELLSEPDSLEGRMLKEWTSEQPGRTRIISRDDDQRVVFQSLLGGRHTITLTQIPIRASDGTLLGTAGIFHDQSNEMAIEQMRTQLLELLARDMHDPLTSIQSAHDTLLSGDLGTGNERVVTTARRTTLKLLELVQTLQEISRIQHNPASLHRLPHPLRPLIESTVAQMTPLAQQRSINLVVEYGSDGGPVLYDSERMRRVMLNLLDNALKHSPAYGTVRVQTSQSNGVAHVRIFDQGAVIEPEQAATLFDRFGRSGDDQRSGSLGLAFCKQVIEAHGGRIWIESSPGKGSTFTFSLPA